ncbi:N-acetylmuramoyl-L-alanine amidase family protein [Gemmatimonas phototrophica]|uniref:N-acetylmuramoyl-L-alanine amidase family protein n=1 Tax=Gemmatimonas phototrophica TaxID=1379270 RepID=UPI0006A6D62A|nr:N-acetylmuramoyl-L-alanine amidase [Gemmatimonas phototrophica]
MSTVFAALGLMLQVVAVAQPVSLTVRLGERVREVPVVAADGGGLALRADVLAEALGGQLVRDGARSGRYRLEVGRIGIDIETGTAFAVVANDTLPLSGPVFRRAAQLYVPMGLAADLLPRIGTGVMFDAEKRELRRFAPVAAAKRPVAPARQPASPGAAPRATGGNAAATRSGRQRVVVVDAGHGGRDNGMSGPIGGGPRIYEKNVTLAVSKQLQRALETRGIRVVMTRTTDTLIGLYDRGPIANAAKGDLFVSIHVNAANPRWQNPGGARGFETYFLAEAKTEDERRVAAMENEAVKFETNADVSRDDPLGFIMRDMAQNEHLRESMRLATLIQSGMRTVHPGPNRGVKQAGLVVLVTAFMPAVLVEIGFGTNRAEAAYITSPERQAELADRLADAVERYLDEYDRKVGG